MPSRIATGCRLGSTERLPGATSGRARLGRRVIAAGARFIVPPGRLAPPGRRLAAPAVVPELARHRLTQPMSTPRWTTILLWAIAVATPLGWSSVAFVYF